MIEIFIFLLGLIFGSFISAVSYRFPRKISFVGGRSFCPHCKKQIGWRDNIPLLSFILLGGKCRNCKKAISPRYPLIEVGTAIGFLLLYINRASLPYNIYFFLLIFVILFVIFVIDLEHQIIPDDLVSVGIVLLFSYHLFSNHPYIYSSICAGFLASILLLLIHLITKGKGMGLGDVKFAVLGGLIVGLNLTGIWLLSAFLTGAVAGIILILAKRAGLKDKIAFGPFLVLGLFISLLWGEKLMHLLSLNF